MRAEVDDDRCRGHGICVAICPEVFTLIDDGYVRAEFGDIKDSLISAVTEAAQACPERAIKTQ